MVNLVVAADTLVLMEFQENVPLAPFTTFKIGGPARWFAEAASEADLLKAVEFANTRKLPLFVLGGGSNLLVSDSGFPGIVLRIALKGIDDSFDKDCLILKAGAGEDWDGLVKHAVSLECAGIECLAGIPGTVGGTPVQNVGAYGQEVSQTIRGLRALNLETCEFVEMTAEECSFTYRQSIFNTSAKGKFLVTRVDYSLTPGGLPTLAYADLKRHFETWDHAPSLSEVAGAVRVIRRQKGMFLVEGDPDTASAGSFFKNPVVDEATLGRIEAGLPVGTVVARYPSPDGRVKVAAAWLVEQAGFSKGYGEGQVGISSRHTLALVNRGAATAEEVLALSLQIVGSVEARFGVRLEREPFFLGAANPD